MTRHIILTAILTTFIFVCHGQTNLNSIDKFVNYKIKVDSNNFPIDSNQFYFPIELFIDSNLTYASKGNEDNVVSWYSEHLRAMREPLLFNRKINKEVFRFTWIRTEHHPIVIRIEKNGESYKLFWKETDGTGGYLTGKLIVDKEKTIDKATWVTFQKLLEQIKFWDTPTNKVEEIYEKPGADWVLEGVNLVNYHIVDRWSPKDNFFNCCNYLINLTDLQFKNDEKY